MVKHKSTQTKAASLFEVRLPNLENDVLVLKGSEHDAPSALVLGKIVLLLKEPLTVKNVTLRLYSTVRLSWIDNIPTANGNVITRPLRFEKKLYEHSWDNVDFSSYLNPYTHDPTSATGSATAPSLSRSSLSVSLKSLGKSMRQKSSTSLSNMNLGPLTHHHHSSSSSLSANHNSERVQSTQTLVVGNYEFPFSAVLPGNMPESLEGLPGASNVYRLEATVDRGKFHGNMVAKKHMRVVRTMTSDAVELSELVLVDNTWPKKVEYSLNVPARAIAVGSGTPINCIFVPLAKGLRLGKITIQLLELYSYIGYVPPIHSGERVVAERIVTAPLDDAPQYSMDRWEVDTFLRVPTSLLKITQDCDIQQHIKVRHKIKFNIGLINPDGHVSELRASLPVQLFISPFIPVSGRPEEQLFDTDNASLKSSDANAGSSASGNSGGANASTSASASASASTSGGNSTSASSLAHHRPLEDENDTLDEEEPVISAIIAGASATNLAHNPLLPSTDSSFASLPGLMAPPLYERHIHDRVWSDNLPNESPVVSISNTPSGFSYLNIGTNDGYFGYDPLNDDPSSLQQQQDGIDATLLGHNLNLLRLLRQNLSQSDTLSEHRATFSLDVNENAPSALTIPEMSLRSRPDLLRNQSSHLHTPQAFSPPTHLLRASSNFKLDTLTMVPSYNQAMKSGTNDELLAPAYKPPMPGSSVNLAEVNRRFEELTMMSAQPGLLGGKLRNLSRGSSLSNLRALTGGKSTSTGSSPLHSRNVSFNNLTTLPLLSSTTPTSSGRQRGAGAANAAGASSGTTGSASSSTTTIASRPVSVASSRNGSFMNLLLSESTVPSALSPTSIQRHSSSGDASSPGGTGRLSRTRKSDQR